MILLLQYSNLELHSATKWYWKGTVLVAHTVDLLQSTKGNIKAVKIWLGNGQQRIMIIWPFQDLCTIIIMMSLISYRYLFILRTGHNSRIEEDYIISNNRPGNWFNDQKCIQPELNKNCVWALLIINAQTISKMNIFCITS